MNKTILIHKSNVEDEVSINIINMANSGEREVYQQEGIGLADILWNVLPAFTIDSLMDRLNELQAIWIQGNEE